ncbi:MAG TPA: hypothetical protein VFN38_10925, partial [Gemmatimonadaceae bacterium]|nr:hypothetical protein [Gemmatimonadaceae bacterium]
TDQPESVPELVRRFDGGADVVVGERPADAVVAPQPVRALRRLAPWVVRPFVTVPACATRSPRCGCSASP